jgi:Txe/YoeB family toxin of Txe-Axe toxin-antitoxin module
LKETKKDIEALKKRLSNLEGLYYRCWSKRILTESSVVSMTSENVKKIINYEKAENEKKYGKYSLSYM